MKLLKDYRLLFLLLIVPYLFVLNLPYVGEEANWVIPSFEMSYFKEYVLQTIYKNLIIDLLFLTTPLSYFQSFLDGNTPKLSKGFRL
jgi:hypothetical protein